MSIEQKDTYFVAVKVFLKRNEELLILKDDFGDWDLPGGRIKKDEFEAPLEQIIQRKLREELGEKIKYSVGKPVVFLRHERVEACPPLSATSGAGWRATESNPTVRIFAIGYEATLESGEIHLSPRHTEMKWVDTHNFHPEDYFTGGWLKGVKEYLSIQNQ